MKTNLLLCIALTGFLLPITGRSQEPKPAPAQPNWQQLREELRDMPPEERQAKLREMRERFAGAEGTRPFQGGAQPGVMAGRMGGIERVFMVLTPEQRESMRKAAEENRDTVRDLEEKLRDARKAALEAAVGKDFNEATLRQKLEAAAKIDTDLTVLRAKSLAKVEPPLSEEQIEQINNPPPMGEVLRERLQQGGAPGERPFRNPNRPGQRPPGPRDENDLPPPPQP